MKASAQCVAVVKKASSMLCIIKRGTENKTVNIIMALYKMLVRLHPEYSIQFWSPHLKKGIVELEKVKKRVTTMMTGLGHLPYEERLQCVGLFSLEKRHLGGDMIEMYKVMQGIDNVDRAKLFSLSHKTRIMGTSTPMECRENENRQKKIFLYPACC